MLIDTLFILAMLIALFKGIRNGLIIAVFSLVGWVIGLYAALKFSSVAAEYLKDYINPRWLSILSFIIVFFIVVILIHLGAKLIEKVVEISLLGWANRLGGIIFYVLLYTFIFSVIILFAEKTRLLTEEATASSKVYGWLKPLIHIKLLSFLL